MALVSDCEQNFTAYENLGPIRRSTRTPAAILVAGVPGTGKSTLAEGLVGALRAPLFSLDWQLGALMPFRVLTNENASELGEMMLVAALAQQLQLGLDVVIDTPATTAASRRRYQAVAENLGGKFIGVECVCSNESAHRERVETRDRHIPGWPSTVSWEHVQRMNAQWETWDEPHLRLDSATAKPDELLQRVMTTIGEN